MKLNADEKRCLDLLQEWSQQGRVNCVSNEVIGALKLDAEKYKSVMKKMEEIGAIKVRLRGMGIDYAAYFTIPERRVLEEMAQLSADEL